jgi:hypothetical protein
MGKIVRVAGFSAKGRRHLVDRTEFIGSNGKVNYTGLVKKIDQMGKRLITETRLLEKI